MEFFQFLEIQVYDHEMALSAPLKKMFRAHQESEPGSILIRLPSEYKGDDETLHVFFSNDGLVEFQLTGSECFIGHKSDDGSFSFLRDAKGPRISVMVRYHKVVFLDRDVRWLTDEKLRELATAYHATFLDYTLVREQLSRI